jgi:fimbrial chaperone protein
MAGDPTTAMARSFLLALVAAGLALSASPAAAFKLIPFSATFTPTGSGASQAFRVENDSDQSIAVQLSVVHREMAIDGKETLTDAENDFAVFPAQLVLLPGEGRAVRVQWLGDAAPKGELAYRLIAEQLPVELNPQQTQNSRIRVLIRYEATVYVTPPGVAPNLAILSAAPAAASAKPMLEITVQNRGSQHAILHNLTLTLRPKAGGSSVALAGEQVSGMVEENVLAGHTRRFLLPWPAGLPLGEVVGAMKIENVP